MVRHPIERDAAEQAERHAQNSARTCPTERPSPRASLEIAADMDARADRLYSLANRLVGEAEDLRRAARRIEAGQ